MDQITDLLTHFDPTPQNLLIVAVAVLILIFIIRSIFGMARFLFRLLIWLVILGAVAYAFFRFGG